MSSQLAMVGIGGAGGAVLNPALLPGLFAAYTMAPGTLWQDSARTVPVIAAGNPIGAWDDQSGGGFHLTQAVAGNQPVYSGSAFYGRPCAVFDTDDFLLSMALGAAFSGTDVLISVLALVYPTVIGATASVWGLGRTASNVPFRNGRLNMVNQFEFTSRNDANSAINNIESGVPVVAQGYAIGSVYNGLSAALYRGQQQTLAPQAAQTGATTMDNFTIGCLSRIANTLFWKGYIAALYVYSVALTEVQAKAGLRYLQLSGGV